jgi:hypothetical protein
MKKKLGAVIATAAVAFALLPATDALAAHNIGTTREGCYGPAGKSGYAAVRIATVGIGSDAPRNGVAAARGKMEISPKCSSKGIKVTRFQIQSVNLTSAGGKIFAKSGSLTGSHSITVDTKGIKVPCGVVVHPVVHGNIRYANGTLVSGIVVGNDFKRC